MLEKEIAKNNILQVISLQLIYLFRESLFILEAMGKWRRLAIVFAALASVVILARAIHRIDESLEHQPVVSRR